MQFPTANVANRLNKSSIFAALGKVESVNALGLGGGFEFNTDTGFVDFHYALGEYSLFSWRILLEAGYSWGQKIGYGNGILALGFVGLLFDLGINVPFKDEKVRFVYGPSLDIPTGDLFFRLYYRVEYLGPDQASVKKLGLGLAFMF